MLMKSVKYPLLPTSSYLRIYMLKLCRTRQSTYEVDFFVFVWNTTIIGNGGARGMDVSIIIPNYNGEAYIMDCLACIYDQISDKKAIIIIDNNSTDNSLRLIKHYYPDITIIKNEVNVGFAKAVNQGIAASHTKYVVLLNNDAFAKQHFLMFLYQRIEQDPRIFSISPKVLTYQAPDIIDNAGDAFTLLGWARQVGNGMRSEFYQTERITFSSCAAAAIYRREVLVEMGMFDDSFFAYLEDVDVGFRANAMGYVSIYLPRAEVLHIGSATSGSKHNDFKVSLSARNTVWLLAKNMPFLMLLLNSPFILLGFFIKWIYFLAKGFGKSYAIGLIQGFLSLGRISRAKLTRGNFSRYMRIEKMMIDDTISCVRSFILKKTSDAGSKT